MNLVNLSKSYNWQLWFNKHKYKTVILSSDLSVIDASAHQSPSLVTLVHKRA